MSSREASGLRSLSVMVALLGACLILAIDGCASAQPSTTRAPGGQPASNASCSLRAVVNIRQGALIRNDAELVDAARRLSVNISVLQSMGRNSRMVVFRENGPQAQCEESLATLRDDLRIESIERY
jgi:hypothetical protein